MKKSEVTEEFLDTYEGEVLFLSQDLEELITELQERTFTVQTLVLLRQKVEDVSDVFLSSTYTQHVSPLFKNFAELIVSLEYNRLKNSEEAITYLSEIIDDINTYINFYFVERNFTDVYLFEDSLENSIDFFKRTYDCKSGECSEDDGSEVDFF